jgi:hypothetical protein
MRTLVCAQPLEDSVLCMDQMVLYRTGFCFSVVYAQIRIVSTMYYVLRVVPKNKQGLFL